MWQASDDWVSSGTRSCPAAERETSSLDAASYRVSKCSEVQLLVCLHYVHLTSDVPYEGEFGSIPAIMQRCTVSQGADGTALIPNRNCQATKLIIKECTL